MKRPKQNKEMETFSVSVSAQTKRRLKKAAERSFQGNVSALIEAVALEADRQDAIDWLLRHKKPIDQNQFEDFLHEMTSASKKRKVRAA
jgi:hypothetical protein